MKTQFDRLIYWLPRVISIIFILFLSLFSLDVFGNDYGFWQTVLGLVMHNIPSIVLLIVLLLAWKHEIIGVFAYLLFGLLYALMVLRIILTNGFEWFYLVWILQISGFAFLVSFLFFLNLRNKKN